MTDQNTGRRFGDGEGEETFDAAFTIKGVDLETRADGGEEGVFQGYASTFHNKDLQDDIILPGAFKGARAPQVRMLWQHDPGKVIGTWDELGENDRGLFVKGRLIMEVDQGREAYHLLKRKAIDAMSVGFRIPNRKRDMDIDEETGVRRIKRVDLWEVSVVTFPANPKARIGRVKDALSHDEDPDIRDLECALRDVGLSQSQAKRLLAGGYEALVQRDVPECDLETVAALIRRHDSIFNLRSPL